MKRMKTERTFRRSISQWLCDHQRHSWGRKRYVRHDGHRARYRCACGEFEYVNTGVR